MLLYCSTQEAAGIHECSRQDILKCETKTSSALLGLKSLYYPRKSCRPIVLDAHSMIALSFAKNDRSRQLFLSF